MGLSPKAVQVLATLFSDQSNLQLPVAVAAEVLEIRQWIAERLKETK